MEAIDKIGIELEGFWSRDKIPRTRKSDGSVSVYGTSAGFTGETVSPPYQRLGNVVNWMEENFPVLWNASCGLHMHVSFKEPWHYGAIMEERFNNEIFSKWNEFIQTMQSEIEKACFIERIRGENQFCRKIFEPKAFYAGGDRYRAINFVAYQRHRTIEFRVAPMMELADAIRYVRLNHDVINKYFDSLNENSFPQLELEYEGEETSTLSLGEI